uniref:Putative secreted protein n=1 Tax=Anopheles darlingi TaxID=43151 RepID=A0A2M4D8B8_ANODA
MISWRAFRGLVLLSDVFRVCAWYSSASTYVAAFVRCRVLIAIDTACRFPCVCVCLLHNDRLILLYGLR